MAACKGVDGLLKIVQFQLRNLSLWTMLPSKLHTSAACFSTFSVTRELWGKTQAEIEEEKGIPEPPAETIYHCRRDIKCSPSKINLVARQIRGLHVEEAIKQMTFSPKKAAESVKEVIQEAQKMAKDKYGVVDTNYLWIAESYVGNGRCIKKIRIHGRGRFGLERRKYSHYFLVLKEGTGPEKNIKRRLKHMTELQEIMAHPRRIRNSLAWW